MDSLIEARSKFRQLSWEEQKATDFRKLFDREADTDLVANCIYHQDDTASMVIYSNAVYCYGCKRRKWPDTFLKDMAVLDIDALSTARAARKQPAPKYIPLGQVDTYRTWLWGRPDDKGYYAHRQTFLLERGLTPDICRMNWIGHTGEAFTIPLIDPVRGVESIRYRRDDELAAEDRPKYWGTGGANQAKLYVPTHIPEQTFNFTYGTILCEGELDALRLAQEGYPAVSMTNGCNALKPEHVEALRGSFINLRNRVTVCYDMDDPGRDGAARAVDMLEKAGFKAHSLLWKIQYGKDITEYLLGAWPELLQGQLEQLWRCG